MAIELIAPRGPRAPHLLRIAQVMLVVYVLLVVVRGFTTLPTFYQRVTTQTVPEIQFADGTSISNAVFDEYATTLGISLNRYAALTIATSIPILAVGLAIGALVLWRMRDSWFGLLTATVLMLTPTALFLNPISMAELPPAHLFLFDLAGMVWPFFFLWLYLFPDGRAVPRWSLWIAVPTYLYLFASFLADILLPLSEQAAALANLFTGGSIVFAILVPLILGSQVYRYRQVSGPVEKEQTKWFVFGLALFLLVVLLFLTMPSFATFNNAIGHIELIILPLAIGISILRYRLWDIDVIIRRTTTYAIITSLLVFVYFGSVVVLQKLFTDLTGQSSTIAVVLSTLLIAALFLPLRRRVQDWVDRRFFRRKYDAEKVLDAFAATVRDETDLDRLTAELVRVIQETMQPATISIALFEDTESTKQPVAKEA